MEAENKTRFSWSYSRSIFTWIFIKKVIRTTMLVLTWICMGSYLELSGPTLKDFTFRMDKTYGEISGAISGRSIGKFIGVLLGGVLVDSFGRFCDLMIAVSMTVVAVTTLSMPWVMNVDLLWFMYVLLGSCVGIINIAGQRIILCMWLENSASPMHVVHLGYGIGAFLAPIIANPFLANFSTEDNPYNVSGRFNSSLTSNSSLFNPQNMTSDCLFSKPVSTIENAYIIVAIMTGCVSAMFFIYQAMLLRELKLEKKQRVDESKCNEKEEKDNLNSGENSKDKEVVVIDNKLYQKKTLLEMINPAKCANGRCMYGSAILGFMFLRYMMYTGLDRNLGIFLRSYAVEQLHFAKDDAMVLNSIFFLFYGFGRFVAFLVAVFVSIKIMFIVESFGLFVITILSAIFARDNDIALWVLAPLAGFAIGPMFPTGFAWSDAHIDMTGLAMTWVLLGSAIGGWCMLKFASLLYDKYGLSVYVFVSLGFCIAQMGTDLILVAISIINSRKLKNKDVDNDEPQDLKKEE